MDIPIGVDGLIRRGAHTGFQIRIEHDIADTGGYYILLSRDLEGYGSWVADCEDLVAVFAETGWIVDWGLAPEIPPGTPGSS
ncbi:hypothetical protein [Propionibacterium australiense]|uniref:hypothetical protein n=1 Tax=Propionibacterium australiense TaxID=119981 RepID=UPI000E5BE600|nr:hypothetical protein [Propionibacterium australiense]RLP06099.1 hypothetical protein D9T14_12775 [Propionibacterium australiense]